MRRRRPAKPLKPRLCPRLGQRTVGQVAQIVHLEDPQEREDGSAAAAAAAVMPRPAPWSFGTVELQEPLLPGASLYRATRDRW